jgi:hypothetical protein
MAGAYLSFAGSRNLGVSTNYYAVVSWGESRVMAERDEGWKTVNCEQQQLVLDFPSNTVTITSTLSMTPETCGKMNKASKKQAEVFTLRHYPLEAYPDKQDNPFLKERAK